MPRVNRKFPNHGQPTGYGELANSRGPPALAPELEAGPRIEPKGRLFEPCKFSTPDSMQSPDMLHTSLLQPREEGAGACSVQCFADAPP
eukprot:5191123-Alexandrium_andersonii.AAC.1